ncbi:sensor histidine kinase [Dechloromonas sp. H13]|uniref:sensor histidine kinase n=1 Tax=Dechloromonas sp. H13 TaxID=2570193 RepID=UPI001292A4BB|nr:sensor histidine kinase [Dechloromonas sp. H13]
MDLRRRLLGSLGLLLAGLMAMALVIQVHSLRADIQAEVDASERLVNVLLATGSGEANLAEQLSSAQFRHLRIRTGNQPPPTGTAHPLLAILGLAPAAPMEREIRIGGQTLYIAPNPRSEIDERLDDTVRLLITLLLYSGATLLVAWWSADRALRPVRALEEGLHRLARGEDDPALPAFALREFRRVAGAIEQLAAALAEARAAQQSLARQLISVQEDERRSLARELHDEMGQTLTALNATAAHLARNAGRLDTAAVAECAGDLRRDIRTSGEQLRAMLKSLRPHGLDAAGIANALRELVGGWRGRETGIEFALSLPGRFPDIDESTALTLYRITQEALTNVVRHSQSRHCAVTVTLAEGDVRLDIEDNGIGLPSSRSSRCGGLLGMRERLAMVGGRLDIDTRIGGGLRLSATIPLSQL